MSRSELISLGEESDATDDPGEKVGYTFFLRPRLRSSSWFEGGDRAEEEGAAPVGRAGTGSHKEFFGGERSRRSKD
jgi:hypothetical protein